MPVFANTTAPIAQFTKDYPSLEKFIFEPPKSNFFLGYGFVPIGVIDKKTYFAVNMFQLHYITSLWDHEIFSFSLGKISSNNKFAEANNFVVRTIPKINVLTLFKDVQISLGPILGYEYIKFNNVKTQLRKNDYVTNKDDLSSGAFITGLALTETFNYKGNKIKVSQMMIKQNYSIKKVNYGWTHDYSDTSPEAESEENQSVMKANTIYMIEVSYLF